MTAFQHRVWRVVRMNVQLFIILLLYIGTSPISGTFESTTQQRISYNSVMTSMPLFTRFYTILTR
jgi:hypothetical protein